jgi:hypothetical protein
VIPAQLFDYSTLGVGFSGYHIKGQTSIRGKGGQFKTNFKKVMLSKNLRDKKGKRIMTNCITRSVRILECINEVLDEVKRIENDSVKTLSPVKFSKTDKKDMVIHHATMMKHICVDNHVENLINDAVGIVV